MIEHSLRKGTHVIAATALSASLLMIGCQSSPYDTSPSKGDIGTVAGGVVGAAIGSQVGDEGATRAAATVGGALLGGFLGRSIGQYMEEQDRRQAGYALENARTDETVTWTNPDTGYEYNFTPTETYTRQNRPCREFVTQVSIEGRWETVRGTACRQPDGSWQIISSS